MMAGRVMYGEIISKVDGTFAPVNVKLTLADTIANPVKSHVDGFGAALFDGVVGDAAGGAIVGL